MIRFVFLAAFVAGAFALPGARVVGGESSTINDVPYIVSIQANISGALEHVCGGVIIEENVILTAARCSRLAAGSIVRAGSNAYASGGQVSVIEKIVAHERFNSANDYDFALLFLNSSLTLNGKTVAKALLPVQDQVFRDGEEAIVSGWGSTSNYVTLSPTLRSAEIAIIDQYVCAALYASVGVVSDRMICAGIIAAGGAGFCDGDIGGPLTVEGRLAGISSWSLNCGLPDFPGVFGSVASVRSWIDQTIVAN